MLQTDDDGRHTDGRQAVSATVVAVGAVG